ncbi:unnamed protein product, partial [Gulo gulo]
GWHSSAAAGAQPGARKRGVSCSRSPAGCNVTPTAAGGGGGRRRPETGTGETERQGEMGTQEKAREAQRLRVLRSAPRRLGVGNNGGEGDGGGCRVCQREAEKRVRNGSAGETNLRGRRDGDTGRHWERWSLKGTGKGGERDRERPSEPGKRTQSGRDSVGDIK